MEGDKKLCKASLVAQPLGLAASTLAQSMGTGPVHTHGPRQGPYMRADSFSFGPFFPLFLSLSSFLSLLLLLLQMTNVCRPLVRLILDSR